MEFGVYQVAYRQRPTDAWAWCASFKFWLDALDYKQQQQERFAGHSAAFIRERQAEFVAFAWTH